MTGKHNAKTGWKKDWVLYYLSVFFVFLLAGCGVNGAGSASGNIEIVFFKVGKADSMLLTIGEDSVLIDTGEDDDGEEITEYLDKQGIESLDYLILTHFDKDHIGGADTVLNEVSVGEVITPDYETASTDYEEYLEALEKNNLTATSLTEALIFTIDSVEFAIYPPEESSYDSDNDYSLVVSVQHGENSFLFTGDAEEIRLEELQAQSDFNLAHTFLKVPYHGRYIANSTAFFTSVDPDYAVITSSEKNPEDEEVVEALEALGTEVYFTRNGNIYLNSDGETITITQ